MSMNGNQADLHHAIDAAVAFDNQLIPADGTINGNTIDMKGKLAIDFAIFSGVLTTGDHTVILEEADDSAFAVNVQLIPTARLLGGQGPLGVALPKFLSTDGDVVRRVGFFKLKRFVRLSIISANTGVGTIGALAIVNPDLTLTT